VASPNYAPSKPVLRHSRPPTCTFTGGSHRHIQHQSLLAHRRWATERRPSSAIDAVEYDFLAITDHTRDVDPALGGPRKRRLVSNFRVHPTYAYESAATARRGDRNVFLLHRGAEINRSEHWYIDRDPLSKTGIPTTSPTPHCGYRYDALTAAHTPEYNRLTAALDLQRPAAGGTCGGNLFSPVVRTTRSGVAEEAARHRAKKGYRSVHASSDHISTHMSYACVWTQ
jgi:hypothetical protein